MITGYNTDIRRGEVHLHVQTEDKGRSNPWIESLIYVGGRVVASSRVNYADLVEAEAAEREIAERVDRHHRGVLAAVRSGKLDDKLGVEPMVSAVPADAAVAAPPESMSLDRMVLDYLEEQAARDGLLLEMESEGELALGASVQIVFRAWSSARGKPVAGVEIEVKLISTVARPETLAQGVTGEDGRWVVDLRLPELGQGSAALIIQGAGDLGTAEIKHLL